MRRPRPRSPAGGRSVHGQAFAAQAAGPCSGQDEGAGQSRAQDGSVSDGRVRQGGDGQGYAPKAG